MNSKPAGIAIAFAMSILITFVVLITLALFGVRDKTLVALAPMYAAPMAGLLIAGYKKPAMFVSPVLTLWIRLNARLNYPIQRVLFILSLVGVVPWVLFRVIGEAFETSTVASYFRSAFYPLANTVFDVGRWTDEPLWYDWAMLVAILGLILSLYFRSLVEPLMMWVRGNATK